MQRDNSLGSGVIYAQEDFPGIMRRFAAMAIDMLIVLPLGVVTSIVSDTFWTISPGYFWGAYVSVTWLYLTVIRTSRISSLGYRLADVKVVTLKGKRPSAFRMTLRLVLWLFGPLNFLTDLFWMGTDPDNQTLRDCMVSTCVVRANATPIAEGPLYLTYFNAMGFSLMYPRVVRKRTGSTV